MITIYQQPTDKNPTLGIYFILFAHESFNIDYEKHADVESANRYLENTKCLLLSTNLEAFWSYAEAIMPEDNQSYLENCKMIRESALLGLKGYDDRYQRMLKDLTSKIKEIKYLVKHAPEDHKKDMIFMASTLVEFVNEESKRYE